jgi:hypothetical protein
VAYKYSIDWLSLAKSRDFGKLANAHWHRRPSTPSTESPPMIEVGSRHANFRRLEPPSQFPLSRQLGSSAEAEEFLTAALPTSQFSTTLNRSNPSSLALLHHAVRLPRIAFSAVKAWGDASPPALPPSLLSTRTLDAFYFAENHSLSRSLSPPIHTIRALHKSLEHGKPG